jgi:hypothetical protein
MPSPALAQSNGCGPEGFGGIVPDGPFSSACDRHDLCYGEVNVDQAQCDSQFKQDMYEICSDRYSGLSKTFCKSLADYYYRAVSNFGEVFITLDGRKISGQILSVQAKRIDDWWGDDEFKACVTFQNDGDINTEYDLELYSSKDKLITRKPKLYEVNVDVGEKEKLCISTNGIYASISDLGSQYKIVLRVDAPQENLLDNLFNGFVSVDFYQGKTP